MQGYVSADGKSAVPDGLYDMAGMADDFVVDQATEEYLHEMFKRAEMAEDQKLHAKYKLEFVIGPEGRSIHNSFSGLILAWTNGGYAHGGGDEVIYFCPTRIDSPSGGQRTCAEALDLRWVGRDVVICPSCKQTCLPKDLIGQVWGRMSMQSWATLVLRTFTALKFDADIRLVTFEGDLHHSTFDERERSSQGERLLRTRLKRDRAIYPLHNIIKDTAAGADLYSRIRAFIGS